MENKFDVQRSWSEGRKEEWKNMGSIGRRNLLVSHVLRPCISCSRVSWCFQCLEIGAKIDEKRKSTFDLTLRTRGKGFHHYRHHCSLCNFTNSRSNSSSFISLPSSTVMEWIRNVNFSVPSAKFECSPLHRSRTNKKILLLVWKGDYPISLSDYTRLGTNFKDVTR